MTKNTLLCCALLALVASIADVAAMVTKAPPVTISAFEEAKPMLYASKSVYNLATLAEKARAGEIKLEVPANFPLDLSRFKDESLDLTDLNNGNGLKFSDFHELYKMNEEVINATFANDQFGLNIIAERGNSAGREDETYISTLRALKGEIACVYGVVKDTYNKRVIITFRGSQNPGANRDWRSNLNARLVNMRTPKKVKDKMEGNIQERVLVHSGFYKYLFDNKFVDGQQRYDDICNDVEPLLEEGYSLYITGHSLGGALATMFSFKLSGAGPKRDWAPRPITCITYAAPISGASSYRAVTEQLELDGLLRSLRFNIGEDLVPAVPPFSLGLRKRTMKHTGINVRLFKGGMRVKHSSVGGFFNAMRNSVLKPVLGALKWHGLELHSNRLDDVKDELSEKTIEELYKDEKVVGKDFLAGKISKYDVNEKEGEEL